MARAGLVVATLAASVAGARGYAYGVRCSSPVTPGQLWMGAISQPSEKSVVLTDAASGRVVPCGAEAPAGSILDVAVEGVPYAEGEPNILVEAIGAASFGIACDNTRTWRHYDFDAAAQVVDPVEMPEAPGDVVSVVAAYAYEEATVYVTPPCLVTTAALPEPGDGAAAGGGGDADPDDSGAAAAADDVDSRDPGSKKKGGSGSSDDAVIIAVAAAAGVAVLACAAYALARGRGADATKPRTTRDEEEARSPKVSPKFERDAGEAPKAAARPSSAA